MLKKTIIALAVASIATSAGAMTLNEYKGGLDLNATFSDSVNAFSTNVLAAQTKQDVLDQTSLDATVVVTFDNTPADDADADELKDGGQIVFQLTGDAKFNASKLADFFVAPNGNTPFSYYTGSSTVSDPITTFSGIEGKGTSELVASPGAVSDSDSTQIYYPADSVEVLSTFLKITDDGTNSLISYELSDNNQRLIVKLADTIANTAKADRVTLLVDFFDSQLRQGFILQSGSASADKMSVGVLQNASYTADPQLTDVLFQTKDLFSLTQTPFGTNETADAVAHVADTYTVWTPRDADSTNDLAAKFRGVTLTNNTTSQNIQYKHVNLQLTGDFSGIAQDDDGMLLAADGSATSWKVVNGVASADLEVLENEANGNLAGEASLSDIVPQLVVDEDNETGLEAQGFTLTVSSIDNATFVPFSQQLANVFVVERDGMKFDTVTTGTSAENQIYIRDVSKTLPEEGGKIFVTITEYAAHDLEANGAGTDVVTRALLPTRLPNNGAVTLTPKGIAEALGVETTPGHQARFLFEVETNQGEAAVRKYTSDGIDIQTGAQDEVPVDFTL